MELKSPGTLSPGLGTIMTAVQKLSCFCVLFLLYRCHPVPWIAFSVMLALVISISTAVIVRYSASPDYTGSYSPTDSRTIPDVSSTLCQGLQLTARPDEETTSIGSYTVSLYALDSPPVLTGREIIDYPRDEARLELKMHDYYYFGFYMYPGSGLEVDICMGTETLDGYVFFYVLQGRGIINDWARAPYEYDEIDTVSRILYECNEDNKPYHYGKLIDEEDYYYLVFYAKYSDTTLYLTGKFLRTFYEVPANFTTGNKCSASTGDSCSVGLPLSGKTALVTVEPDTSFSYGDRLDVDVKCVPRTWMYFLIALATLVGVLIIMAPMIALITIKWRNARATGPDTSSLLPTAGDQTTYGST